MTESAEQSTPPLHERYGAPRATHRTIVRIAWVTGVIGAMVLAWIMWGAFRPTVHSELVSFDVSDPTVTEVSFNVVKPAERAARCTVEALNTGFAQVGVRTIDIAPAEHDQVRVETQIRTSESATTAIIDSCELLD